MSYPRTIFTKYAEGNAYSGFGGGSNVSDANIAASALRIANRELNANLTDEQMRILLGHAAFESNFGLGGSKNSLRNTNNWGAIQATKSFMQQHTSGGYGAVAHGDSDPVSGGFIGWYAVNPTAVAGAKQFLQRVLSQIKASTSVEDYATRLYLTGYYGGFHKGQAGDPRPVGKRSAPFLPAESQNISDYAKAIRRSMPSQLPADTEQSVQRANAMRTGDFAPITQRFHVKTMEEARQLWEKNKASSQAYGVKPASFEDMVASNGAVTNSPGGTPATTTRPSAPPSEVASLDQILENFVHMLAAAASDPTMKRLYKKALPNHDILIKIAAPDYTSAVEFSRVLCSALDEDLLSTSYTYTDGQEVEVECSIPGPATECFAAVEQMTQAVAETFQDATAKIGGISIKAECVINKKSSYQPISLRTAGANYRKFLLKFV